MSCYSRVAVQKESAECLLYLLSRDPFPWVQNRNQLFMGTTFIVRQEYLSRYGNQATGRLTEEPWSIPGKGKRSICFTNVQTGSGAHPAQVVTGAFIRGVKHLERVAGQLPTANFEAKNEQNYISFPPYAFVACKGINSRLHAFYPQSADCLQNYMAGFCFTNTIKRSKTDRQTFKPVIKSPFKFLTPPAVSYPKVNFNPWTVQLVFSPGCSMAYNQMLKM